MRRVPSSVGHARVRPLATRSSASALEGLRKGERVDSVDALTLADRELHALRLEEAWPDGDVIAKIKRLKLGRDKRWHDPKRADQRRKSIVGKAAAQATMMGRTGIGMHQEWDRVNRESLPEVALLGHSNSGKSALLNALSGSEIKTGPAAVSARAGWTAELNFFRAFPAKRPGEPTNIARSSASLDEGADDAMMMMGGMAAVGLPARPSKQGKGAKEAICLVDTPGYGFTVGKEAQLQHWGELISDYLDYSPRLKLCVLLIDSTRGLCDADKRVLKRIRKSFVPVLPVMTKADLLTPDDLAQSHAVISNDINETVQRGPTVRKKDHGPEAGEAPTVITPHTPIMVSSHFYAGVTDLWQTLRRELDHIARLEERKRERDEEQQQRLQEEEIDVEELEQEDELAVEGGRVDSRT